MGEASPPPRPRPPALRGAEGGPPLSPLGWFTCGSELELTKHAGESGGGGAWGSGFKVIVSSCAAASALEH